MIAGLEEISEGSILSLIHISGAFYEGGPVLTTRFGDLEVDYSPYIAHISETDGVIEGVQTSGLWLGPVELAGFYGWATRQVGEGEEAVDVRFVDLGIFGQGEIEGIALQGAAVKTGNDIALAGSAQIAPAPGLDIVGSAAWDGANRATVAKVEAGIGAVSYTHLDVYKRQRSGPLPSQGRFCHK